MSGKRNRDRKTIKKIISQFAEADFTSDEKGNLIVRINPQIKVSIILEAHIDRVAAGVCNISNDGRIYTHSIGRLELNSFLGNRIYIMNDSGEKISAVVCGNIKLPGISLSNESVWLDAGDQYGNVSIGDIAQFLNIPVGMGNTIAASGLDNLVGVICLVELIRQNCNQNKGVILWFSSKEEISGISVPPINLPYKTKFISIDTCFSSDNIDISPNLIDKQYVGKGPILLYDPNCDKTFNREIKDTALKNNIPLQQYLNIVPGHGLTITNHFQSSLKATCSSLLIPLRYMHTPSEVCSLSDINWMIHLLSQIVYGD